MKVALIQMNSQPDREHNLRQAAKLMDKAVREERPDLVVLPEHFDWSGGTLEQKRAAADTIPGGQAYRLAANFAAANRVWVHAGSMLEAISGSNKIHNTTVVFDPKGRQIGLYRKIHLFDITAPDGKTYGESDIVSAGSGLLVYEIDGLKIGCAICYDLRFSELFAQLALADVDVVVLPAAFTAETGKDHWEVLCRARAIEFQTYVLACGQWGPYRDGQGQERRSYGHTLVCDPWGHVISRAPDHMAIVTGRIDRERLAAVRKLIPMSKHRAQAQMAGHHAMPIPLCGHRPSCGLQANTPSSDNSLL